MNSTHNLKRLAQELIQGTLSGKDFLGACEALLCERAETATIDLDRGRRCGFPEVVFAQGKTVSAIEEIVGSLQERGQNVLVTRLQADQVDPLRRSFPALHHHALARTLRTAETPRRDFNTPGSRVAVIAAGTADLPVAEEACETLRWMGIEPLRIIDVGVAGPQRLRRHLPEIRQANAIVVVAGMEGALPSVVGGHVACPVFAVPTSVGYGASFGGVAALLGMLNSCAANVAVCNIDAGFKGGYLAGLIAQGSHATALPRDQADEGPASCCC